MVRRLCWALVVLAIITAITGLGITLGLFVPFPNVSETTPFVDRLEALRAGDAKMYPFLAINSLAAGGLFAVVGLLGVALRPFASGIGWRDVMATLFVVGGTVGVISQAVNLGLANVAASPYCDCGFRNEELIAQDYALGLGYEVVNWLSIGAITLTGIGVALAGPECGRIAAGAPAEDDQIEAI